MNVLGEPSAHLIIFRIVKCITLLLFKLTRSWIISFQNLKTPCIKISNEPYDCIDYKTLQLSELVEKYPKLFEVKVSPGKTFYEARFSARNWIFMAKSSAM